MVPLYEDVQIIPQLKRTANEILKLWIAKAHLLRHVRAIGVANLAFPMANLRENVSLLAIVEEKEVVVIPFLLINFSEIPFSVMHKLTTPRHDPHSQSCNPDCKRSR
jgi:hypothetical protein